MSAIYGLVQPDGPAVQAADLGGMAAAVADLGPHDGGAWADGPVGLGWRLMRVTPQDLLERQPLADPAAPWTLVADARLDNRAALAHDLAIPAAVLATLPDSALILRAYARWGDDCPGHLLGDFAFALWDARRERLLAARSPGGACPLVYYHAPGLLALATMPRGLLPLPSVPRRLDQRRVAGYLMGHYGDDTTIYQGIKKLPSGHTLTFDRRGPRLRRYWRLDLARRIRYPRDSDYVEAFDELFARVVADHMVALAPVGVALSGGLDSTAVAAVAADLAAAGGRRLPTFTETPRPGFTGPLPPGRYADETPFVQAMVHRYPTLEPHLLRADWPALLDELEAFFGCAEIPIRNVANWAWWAVMMRQAAAAGVGVLLTGGQGNLTVSYDGQGLLPHLLRSGQWRRAAHEARALAAGGAGRSALSVLLAHGLDPLLPTPLWGPLRRLALTRRLPRRGAPSVAPLAAGFAARWPDPAQGRRPAWRPHQIAAHTLQARYDQLSHHDALGDLVAGCKALFGVELRSPLLDVRLIEFCLALPEEQYQRDGQPRWLIRRAMADRLPPQILGHRARGLQAADWFEGLSAIRPQLWAELAALEDGATACEAIDLPLLRRLLERWPVQPPADLAAIHQYRHVLPTGLMIGRYLRWWEAGAAGPTT